ncbi:hypothetical protein M513_05061 [Trichuris suis]|uniref:Uncharacterized protein n=1 Tax=Trichuris suis TaxID=68888 RepID=A0A085M9Z6_9BILA|nr:hypothetical protein M513_05061 [Trichuris suis]
MLKYALAELSKLQLSDTNTYSRLSRPCHQRSATIRTDICQRKSYMKRETIHFPAEVIPFCEMRSMNCMSVGFIQFPKAPKDLNVYLYLSLSTTREVQLNAKLAISYLFRQCSHSSQQVHSFSNFSHVDKFERRVTFCRRQANLDKQFTAKATTEKALKVNSLFFQKKIYYRHLLDARIATRLWNGTK